MQPLGYRFQPEKRASLLKVAKRKTWMEKNGKYIAPALVGAASLTGLAAVGAYRYRQGQHRATDDDLNVSDAGTDWHLVQRPDGTLAHVPGHSSTPALVPNFGPQSDIISPTTLGYTAGLGHLASTALPTPNRQVDPSQVRVWLESASSSRSPSRPSTPRRIEIDQELINGTQQRIDEDVGFRTPIELSPRSRSSSSSSSRSSPMLTPRRISIDQDLGPPAPRDPPPLPPSYPPPQPIGTYDQYMDTLNPFGRIANWVEELIPGRQEEQTTLPTITRVGDSLFTNTATLLERLNTPVIKRVYVTDVSSGSNPRSRMRFDKYARDYWSYRSGYIKLSDGHWHPKEGPRYPPDEPERMKDSRTVRERDARIYARIRDMIDDDTQDAALAAITEMRGDPNGDLDVYVPEIVREAFAIRLIAPNELKKKK